MKESRLNNKIKRSKWAATRANAALNNLSNTDVDALIAQYLIDNPVGGSVGKIVAFESGQIPTGGTGTLLTRTAASNKYFKLTHFLSNTSNASSMVLNVNGVAVFSGTLAGSTPSASASSSVFGIASGYGSGTPSGGARILKEVYCTSFNFVTTSPSLGVALDYAYETLEDL